jgi:hypothetical protein
MRLEHGGTLIGFFGDLIEKWVKIPQIGPLCFIFQKECAFLKHLKRLKQMKQVKQLKHVKHLAESSGRTH